MTKTTTGVGWRITSRAWQMHTRACEIIAGRFWSYSHIVDECARGVSDTHITHVANAIRHTRKATQCVWLGIRLFRYLDFPG